MYACLDDDILHVNMLKKIDDSTTYISFQNVYITEEHYITCCIIQERNFQENI